MVYEIFKRLVKNNYNQASIIVLSMYNKQVNLIKQKLSSNSFKNIHCTTVDNYQGLENQIVVLSLVRSNAREEIGFLSISNRIVVALSRSNCALYCVGNFDTNNLWFYS